MLIFCIFHIKKKVEEILANKSKGGNDVTIISSLISIEGRLDLEGSVRIDGNVKGDINSSGTLIIGRTGNVRSNVKAEEVIIEGNYEGDMDAEGSVRIRSTGKFIGNLSQKMEGKFEIEKGGLFKGKSSVKG